MAKQSAINYSDVVAACNALLAAGMSVSFQSVYAQLGNRGSAKVVNAHIGQWKAEAAEKLAAFCAIITSILRKTRLD